MADCSCLSGKTTTVYECDDVKLTSGLGYAEGLVNDELECLKTEILVNVLLVDGNSACAGNYANTGNALLSSTCTVEVGLKTCSPLLAADTRSSFAEAIATFKRKSGILIIS